MFKCLNISHSFFFEILKYWYIQINHIHYLFKLWEKEGNEPMQRQRATVRHIERESRGESESETHPLSVTLNARPRQLQRKTHWRQTSNHSFLCARGCMIVMILGWKRDPHPTWASAIPHSTVIPHRQSDPSRALNLLNPSQNIIQPISVHLGHSPTAHLQMSSPAIKSWRKRTKPDQIRPLDSIKSLKGEGKLRQI